MLMHLYWRTNAKDKQGFLFGMFLILIFTARFVIEFMKENQEAFEASMKMCIRDRVKPDRRPA